MTTTELVPQGQIDLTEFVFEKSELKDVDEKTIRANQDLGTAFYQKAAPAGKGYPLINLKNIQHIFDQQSQQYVDSQNHFRDQKYIRGMNKYGDVRYFEGFPKGPDFRSTKELSDSGYEMRRTSSEIEYYGDAGKILFKSIIMPTEKTFKEVGVVEVDLSHHDGLIPYDQAIHIKEAKHEFDAVRIWDVYEKDEEDLGIDSALEIHNRNVKEMSKLRYKTRTKLNKLQRAYSESAIHEGIQNFKETTSNVMTDPVAVGVKRISGTDHYYFIAGWV